MMPQKRSWKPWAWLITHRADTVSAQENRPSKGVTNATHLFSRVALSSSSGHVLPSQILSQRHTHFIMWLLGCIIGFWIITSISPSYGSPQEHAMFTSPLIAVKDTPPTISPSCQPMVVSGSSHEQTRNVEAAPRLPDPSSKPLSVQSHPVSCLSDPAGEAVSVDLASPQFIPLRVEHPANTSATMADAGSPEWFLDILKDIIRWILGAIGWLLSQILHFFHFQDFVLRTDPALSYNHDAVKQLHAWSLSLVSGLLSLQLVLVGYHIMLGRTQDAKETLLRLALVLIATIFSRFIMQQAIDLGNVFCDGALHFFAGFGHTDVITPMAKIDYIKSPIYQILAYLCSLVFSILVCLQMLVRLALLDFLIVLSPLGIICLATPHTRPWGSLWLSLLVSTIVIQFLQVMCLGLGTVLIANPSSDLPHTLLSLFTGVACAYLALQLPSMFSISLAESVGSVRAGSGRGENFRRWMRGQRTGGGDGSSRNEMHHRYENA